MLYIILYTAIGIFTILTHNGPRRTHMPQVKEAGTPLSGLVDGQLQPLVTSAAYWASQAQSEDL